jgi:hypothetical protein
MNAHAAAIEAFITTRCFRRTAGVGRPAPRRNGNGIRQYDNTNRGALFRNDDKDPNNDKERDYSGTLDVEGAEYWVSGWVRTSKKTGKKYLSLSVKPKVEKPAESERKSPAEDFDDRIPF